MHGASDEQDTPLKTLCLFWYLCFHFLSRSKLQVAFWAFHNKPSPIQLHSHPLPYIWKLGTILSTDPTISFQPHCTIPLSDPHTFLTLRIHLGDIIGSVHPLFRLFIPSILPPGLSPLSPSDFLLTHSLIFN